jgi:lysozyme
MSYRDILLKNLIQEEALRTKMYKCPEGFNTIGAGHNCDANPLKEPFATYLKENGELTVDMVKLILGEDIEDAETDARKLFPDFNHYAENRQVAIVDLVFNMGLSRFSKFVRTIQAIRSQQWDLAAKGLRESKWFRQVGDRGPKIINLIK